MQREHQIPKGKFKAKALEYFREVETTGESIIVTDNGKPTIEVRAYHPHELPPLQRLKGSVLSFQQPFEPVAQSDWEMLK